MSLIDRAINKNFVDKNNFDFYFTDFIDVKYHVISTNLPPVLGSFSYEQNIGGNKYLEKYEFPDEFTITLRETTDFKILQYLQDWVNIFYDRDKKIFKILSFENADKKQGVISFYSRQGIIEKTFYLNNLSFSKIDEISLSYDEVEILAWELTVKVEEVT